MKRVASIILPFTGLAIFVFIIVRTGPGRVAAIIGDIDPRRLAWAPLIMAAIALVRGARWRYIIHALGTEYGLGRSTLVWTIGFFASSVTPAKAGDAVRALYLRNDTGRTMGEAFLTVFVDRLWDLGFVLLAGVASALWFSHRYIAIPSTPLFILGAVLIAAAAAVATRRDLTRALLKPAFMVLVPARHRGALKTGFNSFYDSLGAYGGNPRRAAALTILTVVCWGLIYLLALYVTRLLSIGVSPGYVALMLPVVTLVELIPFSISGLGTRDATVIYFFSVVGIGSAQAVGFSIVYVLIGTYFTALVGFALWLRHPLRFPTAERP